MAPSNDVSVSSTPTVPVGRTGPHLVAPARAESSSQAIEFPIALKVGTKFTTESRVVTTQKRDYFTLSTGDDSDLHTDTEAAHDAGFDGPIAHGMHVQSMAVELMRQKGLQLLEETPFFPVIRSNGFKFVNDVKFGDNIHVRCLVTNVEPLAVGFLVRCKTSIHTEIERVQHGQVTLKILPKPKRG